MKALLSKWKNQGYISNANYKSLLFTDGTLPRAYGLPKIHKIGIPFRLSVSSVNSPLDSLALFLHKIMMKNFPIAPSHINNSFDLVHNLSNIFIDNDSKLISLLFPCSRMFRLTWLSLVSRTDGISYATSAWMWVFKRS